MFDFHEKRKLRRILYSKAALIVLGVLVVWFSYQVFIVYEKDKQARERRAESVALLQELEGRKNQLRSEVERLSTDRGIEEEIRDRFEVAREGEQVIVIVDAPEESKQKPEKKKGFFERLFDWF